MYSLGIDIGSRNTKLCVIDSITNEIVYNTYAGTDVSPKNTVDMLLERLKLDFSQVNSSNQVVGVTGYGRHLLPYAKVFSEIQCHTIGIRNWYPDVRTVIDIGGQDSKIITISDAGKILDFVMNDKCAAGTGRFLEMTAIRLGVDVSYLSLLADNSRIQIELSSTCVVFAESEIIGLVAKSTTAEDIAHAVFQSISRRIKYQSAGLTISNPIVLTGGVAKSRFLCKCLSNEFCTDIIIPDRPEYSGAYGAALLALK